MHFRKQHPWDPGYPLPAHVLTEPGLRGTHTTAYRERRSIDSPVSLPAPWIPNFVMPGYIAAEAPGRGAARSKGLARGTVGARVPEYLGFFGILSNPLPLAVGIAVGFVAAKLLDR